MAWQAEDDPGEALRGGAHSGWGGETAGFQVVLPSRRRPRGEAGGYGERAGGGGDGHRLRRLVRWAGTGLAASILVVAGLCLSGGGPRVRGGGWPWGRGGGGVALAASGGDTSGPGLKAERQRSLHTLAQHRQLAGTNQQLLHRQPGGAAVQQGNTVSRAVVRTLPGGGEGSQELVFGDGCDHGSMVKYGDTYECGGPLHEDTGMMTHENHCMLFSKHPWSFQGISSDFQGADDGANGGLGTLMDPGTNYCLSTLRHPWDGMLGLEVCNRSDVTMLWHKSTYTNGVTGFLTGGTHQVTTYTSAFTSMMLDTGCMGKCYDAQVCLPTAQYRREVNDEDFLDPGVEAGIVKGLPEDPTAPIR